MTDQRDFITIGLQDPGDLDLLTLCAKALRAHIAQKKQQQNDIKLDDDMMDNKINTSTFRKNSSDSGCSTTIDPCIINNDTRISTPLTPPPPFTASSSSLSIAKESPILSSDMIRQHSQPILRVINAFDRYDETSTSDIIVHDDNHMEILDDHSPPPPYPVVIPSIQTNTPSGAMVLTGAPGTVIPRYRGHQRGVSGSRPLSMPVYLPSSPPPDTMMDAALMTVVAQRQKRSERCRSMMILPREEEGNEELPPYSCTVFKMGYVYVKREFESPGVRSKWRTWRKLYVELWGTVLRVYRAPPDHDDKKSNNELYWPLRVPYKYWNKYYYTPIFTFSLAGADATRALDYFRRPNALRLSIQQGPQLLLRLPSHVEMISWIEHLQAAINISLDLEQRPMPKFITLPTRALASGTLDPRSIELERAREQRRRDQREVLI
ncbi:PH domain-like protein [Backusella circina FSU 941]|nr:PH domain-like protein [Backusella circina FSU 941]